MKMPRWMTYLWALPVTCIGLLFLLPAVLGGGEARIVGGVIEVHGRWISWGLRHLVPLSGGASAMTLGHVVIARNQACLDISRDHERVHVRQCERWGPLFIPAYFTASLIAKIKGRNPYFDNAFEREAYENA